MNKTNESKQAVHPPQKSTVSGKTTRTNKLHNSTKSSRTTRAGRPAQPALAYMTARTTKKFGTTLLIGFGVLVVLVASYAVYISTATRTPWFPAGAGEASNELTAGAPLQKAAPVTIAPPVKSDHSAKTATFQPTVPAIHPNAVVDVPRVSLRKTPSIKAKNASGYLKRGEPVEIIGKQSTGGATWVRIRTRTGKVGWAFASVVREHTRG